MTSNAISRAEKQKREHKHTLNTSRGEGDAHAGRDAHTHTWSEAQEAQETHPVEMQSTHDSGRVTAIGRRDGVGGTAAAVVVRL